MNDFVRCPYCDAKNDMHSDYYESSLTFDHECCECGEEFEVEVEFDPCYSAGKIEYKECKECGCEYRFEGRSFPRPKKYKDKSSEEYEICTKCYYELIAEDFQ
jgi:hypothetical protein